MNFLDIFIIIVLCYNAIAGFRRGFVFVVFDFVALFGSIYVGLRYYEVLKDYLMVYISWPEVYVSLISFGVIWLGCFAILLVVSFVVDKLVSIVMLGIVNRIFGLVVGVAKGVILLLPLLIPLYLFDTTWYNESTLVKPVHPTIVMIVDKFIPQANKDKSWLDPTYQNRQISVKNTLSPAAKDVQAVLMKKLTINSD
ncbi:CvpA family protein [Thermoproteota archaeon]